jgi:hypothetical protein
LELAILFLGSVVEGIIISFVLVKWRKVIEWKMPKKRARVRMVLQSIFGPL